MPLVATAATAKKNFFFRGRHGLHPFRCRLVSRRFGRGDHRGGRPEDHRSRQLGSHTSANRARCTLERIEAGAEFQSIVEECRRAKVTVRFLGLHDLNVIHDKLEHGAEIRYSETIVTSRGMAAALVRKKEQLGVFTRRRATRGPDYVDAGIRAEPTRLKNR